MMRILIADNHPAAAEALRRLVQPLLPRVAVEVVHCGDALLARLTEEPSFDLLIQDLSMPAPLRLCELVRAVRSKAAELPIVLCAASDKPAVLLAALNARVRGFIPKSHGVEPVKAAIAYVTTGGTYIDPSFHLTAAAMHPWFDLTSGEREVALLAARGASTRDICEMTHRTYAMVAIHKMKALGKLGLSSADELAVYIHEHGLGFELDEVSGSAALRFFA